MLTKVFLMRIFCAVFVILLFCYSEYFVILYFIKNIFLETGIWLVGKNEVAVLSFDSIQ